MVHVIIILLNAAPLIFHFQMKNTFHKYLILSKQKETSGVPLESKKHNQSNLDVMKLATTVLSFIFL